MSTAAAPAGPKTKQGLMFVAMALILTVLATVVFDENNTTTTIIRVASLVVALCAIVLVVQGRKEDTALAAVGPAAEAE